MAPDQPLDGARILVAEDNAILALDLMDLLADAGAEVLGPVATLADTLALARSSSLTCAVLDVNLGSQLVFPAAQVLKDRGVGIIFHTGNCEWERLSQDWPDAWVLTKPAPLKLLIRTICEACIQAGTACERYSATELRAMAQPVDFEVPALAIDLARIILEDAREAISCFIEAARQAHELLNQSTDVLVSAARELHEKAVQHADEHLGLSFKLAQRLIEANGLKDVLRAQREFARKTVETYDRQVQELSRVVTPYTQNPSPESES
jgi:hypothetical protein